MEIKDGYEYYEFYLGNANTPSYIYYRVKDGVLETSDDYQPDVWWIVEDWTFFNERVKNGNGW